MAENTVLPNLKLVRKKGLGTLQISLHWRTGHVTAVQNDSALWRKNVQFFTNRSELEMGQRGIQSEAKNLFFIFFLGWLSFRYRKMRKLFFGD